MIGGCSINKYDTLTQQIMEKSIEDGYNTLDIGASKGLILSMAQTYSPSGQHYGFEPIQSHYDNLLAKFPNPNIHLFNCALSNHRGQHVFYETYPDTGYSGLLKRHMDNMNISVIQKQVETDCLDNLVPKSVLIHFVKIDVEGAELLVLQGGLETISCSKPLIIFEHGIGAADIYGYGPQDIWNYFSSISMNLWTLEKFLGKMSPLSYDEFQNHFNKNDEYMFVAK